MINFAIDKRLKLSFLYDAKKAAKFQAKTFFRPGQRRGGPSKLLEKINVKRINQVKIEKCLISKSVPI